MLYDTNPKTSEEIQQDLNRYIAKDNQMLKYMWLLFAISIPIMALTLGFPEFVPQFINMSVAVFISATLFAIPLGLLLLFKYLIPQNSHFHYILLQPASEKKLILCESMISHETMQQWREYVDKVKSSGRNIYNYEYDAINEHWLNNNLTNHKE